MIAPWASLYVGIPYEDRGVNCWGLVRRVYAEQFGIALPGYDQPGTDTMAVREIMAAERARIEAEAEWTPADPPSVGDVALFRRGTLPAHVGVLVAPSVMLHSQTGIGSALEDFTGPAWAPRLLGIFRHRERAACS